MRRGLSNKALELTGACAAVVSGAARRRGGRGAGSSTLNRWAAKDQVKGS